MSGINRLSNKVLDNLGFDVWGNRDIIPNDFNSEIIETNQELQPGSVDISKIKNLVVDTITVSPTGYIKSGKLSFIDDINSGYYFSSDGVYIGSASDASYLKYSIGAGTFVIKAAITTITGSVVNTDYLSGVIPQVNLNVADRGWTQTCAFSITDADTVSWGSGTFTSADGTVYNISVGNTGNMSAKTYIYLDIGVSTTAYQTTTTGTSAVGVGKVMIAVAQNGAVEPTYTVFQGQGGLNIDAANIVAGSITANEIAASTITAGKMNVSSLSSITANIGSITSGDITLNSSGFIRGGQTDYNTGTGFWMGYSGGAYKFSIGDPSGDYLYWDGTNLTLNGSASLVGTLPWSSITDDGGKPDDNATVGAIWSTNLSGIPTTLEAPSTSGLYLASDFLGYWKSISIGSSTTEFNISNPAGTTARYTWNGNGTDPDIANNIRIGTQVVISGQNFNTNNNGTFTVTGEGTNYFEVTNASVIAEINKSLGTGYIKSNNWNSYIDNSGNFFFRGDNDSLIDWNITSPATLTIKGKIVANSGSIIGTDYLSGTVPQVNLNVSNRGWVQSSVFSVTDADTVSWTSGTFTSADGTTYSISAGNTGNMSAKTYIYLDIAISTTAYQITTTSSTAVGVGKVLIAVAQNGSTTATYALTETTQIIGDNIIANTIDASKITAGQLIVGTNVGLGTAQDSSGVTTIIGNTVTTSFINALNVNAATISASVSITTPTITGGTITIGTGNDIFKAGASGIQLGHATFASAPFSVDMDGNLIATSATITGALTTGAGSTINGTYIDSLGVGKLDAGTISSKAILLGITGGTGDSYIAGGNAIDMATWTGGDGSGGALIYGLDDSDSDKAKFFVGDYSTGQYAQFDGSDFIVNGSNMSNQDIFGDGSDGDVTISSNTTLTSDKYYNNLTVDNTYTLNTGGYRIFVKGTLTNNGTIQRNGVNGTNGSDAIGSNGGTKGVGGTALASGTLVGSATGGDGSNGGSSGGSSSISTVGTSASKSFLAGSNGGTGGSGGNLGGGLWGNQTAATAGGAANIPSNKFKNLTNIVFPYDILPSFSSTITSFISPVSCNSSAGGTGGGGGRQNNQGGAGGGGGGAGSCAGFIQLFAKNIINNGTISAIGGNGGNGGNATNANPSFNDGGGGGGGGGAGGGGGLLTIVYTSLTNSGTISVAGGTGGTGGAFGTGAGTGGNGAVGANGANGNTGLLIYLQV